MIDALDEKTISGSIDLTKIISWAIMYWLHLNWMTNTVSYADTYAAVTIESASDIISFC